MSEHRIRKSQSFQSITGMEITMHEIMLEYHLQQRNSRLIGVVADVAVQFVAEQLEVHHPVGLAFPGDSEVMLALGESSNGEFGDNVDGLLPAQIEQVTPL